LLAKLAKVIITVILVAGAAQKPVLGMLYFRAQFFVDFFGVTQLIETLFTRRLLFFGVIATTILILVLILALDVGLLLRLRFVVGLVLDIVAFLLLF
jgi:hypothetical protein